MTVARERPSRSASCWIDLAEVPCQGDGAATLEHAVIDPRAVGGHALEVSLGSASFPSDAFALRCGRAHRAEKGAAAGRRRPPGSDQVFRLAEGQVLFAGAVSQYNATEAPRGPANYMQLLVARASMAGFVIFDYADRYAERPQLAEWQRNGELRSREDIVHGGIEQFPNVLLRLFDGQNMGKLVLALESETARAGRRPRETA